MVRNGEGQSSHVCVFSVNFERHISTHITTSIECYLNSLADVYVPFINIYAVASEQSLTGRKTIPFRTANGNGSPIICFKTHFKEKCLYP